VPLDKVAHRDADLRLLELAQQAAPDGYVWVTAASAALYYMLRDLEVWQYVETVNIPRYIQNTDPSNPDFDGVPNDVPEKYMTARELSVWRASQEGVEGYYFTEDKKSTVFRGSVMIFEKGPNFGAKVLMRRSDLGPDT
jgi:hypothetical protein